MVTCKFCGNALQYPNDFCANESDAGNCPLKKKVEAVADAKKVVDYLELLVKSKVCRFCGDALHFCTNEQQESTCPIKKSNVMKKTINEAYEGMETKQSDKCIVFGCPNKRSEGSTFIGDLCSPCHELITSGHDGKTQFYGNTFIHDLIRISKEKKSTQEDDRVNHPIHYGGDTAFETIKVLRAWMTIDEYQGFMLGNAIKYLSCWGKKDDGIEDLKKAQWYLNKLVEELSL